MPDPTGSPWRARGIIWPVPAHPKNTAQGYSTMAQASPPRAGTNIGLIGHLAIKAEAAKILEPSIRILCMMRLITSQFLRRERSDRPRITPKGGRNLAFRTLHDVRT